MYRFEYNSSPILKKSHRSLLRFPIDSWFAWRGLTIYFDRKSENYRSFDRDQKSEAFSRASGPQLALVSLTLSFFMLWGITEDTLMPIGPLSSQPPEWKEPTGPVVPTGKSESFKLEKDDPWFNGFVDMLEKSGIFDDASKGKLEEIRKQVNGGQMSSSDGMNKIQTDFRAQCKDAIGKRIIDISDSYSQRLSDLGKACDQGDRDACIKHGHLQAYDNQIWGTLRDLNSGMLTPIQAWNELYNLGKPPYT